ncbi:ubiquitin-specific protease [Histoplasma capsulatum]|uniref:Ubiquitin carboxyl-terminal hydrolase n=1 Tax=Ajellomyces capsulatus TaxID=5037 RepID=A0A8A1M1C2_AJECA|nr:ubiquitin-specific protease [Histoplasma capsulatum]
MTECKMSRCRKLTTISLKLPWLSVPEAPFPARAPRRRRKARTLQASTVRVEFSAKADPSDVKVQESISVEGPSKTAPESEKDGPATPQPSSESNLIQPTTPSSTTASQTGTKPQHTPAQTTGARQAIPIVPIVPIIPSSPSTTKQPPTSPSKTTPTTPKRDGQVSLRPTPDETQTTDTAPSSTESAIPTQDAPKPTPPIRAPPKSWADLVRTKAPPSASSASPTSTRISELGVSKGESLLDVINHLSSNAEQYGDKIAFIEPRGLVNTGNMCYMNSVLQILVFCVPFYEFLDKIGRRAVHTFKSDLPLIDAMIMFMREFRVIDAATSVEQLRLRLKQNELEQYGESFIPEYVYQVIRHLPRFRDMRLIPRSVVTNKTHKSFLVSFLKSSMTSVRRQLNKFHLLDPTFLLLLKPIPHPQHPNSLWKDGWKSATNRDPQSLDPQDTSLQNRQSPKYSAANSDQSLECQETKTPLPLNLTSPFNLTLALPKLLISLMRLKVSLSQRPSKATSTHLGSGLPKYRLTGVIYHHGKNASGGHYTVDVRRQDGREWIRLDDTSIHRVRSEEVANAGSEEDPKVLAAALEQHRLADNPAQGNIFEQFDMEHLAQQENEQGWSHVNGQTSGSGSGHASKKSMAAVVNGTTSPSAESSSGKRTPSSSRFGAGVRENKVAYLLFYQKI